MLSFGEKLASERLGKDNVGIDRVGEIGVPGELLEILEMVGKCTGEPSGPLIVGRRACGLNWGSGESSMTSEVNDGLTSKSSKGRCANEGPLEGVARDSADEESNGDGASSRGSNEVSSEVDTDETSSE